MKLMEDDEKMIESRLQVRKQYLMNLLDDVPVGVRMVLSKERLAKNMPSWMLAAINGSDVLAGANSSSSAA